MRKLKHYKIEKKTKPMKSEANLRYNVVSRKLILLFTIAVGIGISAVYLLNQKTEKLVRRNINLAEIINVSGRQRMLSQNITKNVLISYYTGDNVEEKLHGLLNQFEKSHAFLKETNKDIVISEKQKIAITKSFEKLQPYFQNIAAVSSDTLNKGQVLANIATLRNSEAKFLVLMDEITKLYEESSSNLYTEINNNVKASNVTIIALTIIFSMTVLLVTLRIIKQFSKQLTETLAIQEFTNEELEVSLADQEKKMKDLEVMTNFWKTAKEEAVKNGNIKSQFLSTMSHEIRTPMNAIIGATNLLELENPAMKNDERFRLLKVSSTNLLSLINDILDYQKINSGKLSLNKSSFHLNELVTNVSSIWEPLAKEKNIDLISRVEASLVDASFVGDMTRISQVLNNLLNNALKFTDEGMVQLRVKESEGGILFEVKDTGIGIPEDHLKTIFDQFSQVDNGTTQKVGGTGLGLAISQEIIKLMGGEIQAESRVDFGSKFCFTIDLEKGEVEKQTIRKSKLKKPATEEAIKILIVEDNLGNQTIATGFLEQWGFAYEIANNGKEALDKIESMDFDLVLMDLRMPLLNGFDATASIRSRSHTYFQNVPIIALSASTFSETKQQIFEAGMNDFVSKPFNPEHLYDKIVEHINTELKTAV